MIWSPFCPSGWVFFIESAAFRMKFSKCQVKLHAPWMQLVKAATPRPARSTSGTELDSAWRRCSNSTPCWAYISF